MTTLNNAIAPPIPEMLQHPRDSGQAPPSSERRVWQRTPIMRSARLRSDKLPGKTFAIRILDAAPGGLGFSSSFAMEVGDVIEVLFETSAGLQQARLKVIYCEFIDDGAYRVGAGVTKGSTAVAMIDAQCGVTNLSKAADREFPNRML